MVTRIHAFGPNGELSPGAEAALAGLGGGGGTVTATDTPTAPTEGASASYLVTSAVVWPAGLVWSTDPDGGTEPTITDAALVSFFTVGGTTYAVLGSTYPVPVVSDTTDPTPGTLAVVTGSTTADLTVTGATDDTALHATPYSYSSDNGATWTAYQAGATYQFTGLTASTSYTFRHRVRDAAGNIATGTAVTESTAAPSSDTTPPTVGTLAASSITSSGFTLAVTGASDETALHAEPYRFSTDDGASYSAWQAGATFNASGLDPETEYDCVHQVRDAALNVSTGTAITVTTGAASPATSAFTDFSTYTTAAGVPDGWTHQWDTSPDVAIVEDVAATGGKLLRITNPTNTARVFMAWDAIPSSSDVEIVCRFRVASGATSGHPLRITGSGALGTESAYYGAFQAASITIFKYVAGAPSQVGSQQGTWTIGAWYWMRLRKSGTTLFIKVWETTEPETWTKAGVTDTSLSSGLAGVGAFAVGTTDWDVIGADWSGGTAPVTSP